MRVEGNTLNGTLRALEWRLRLMLGQLVNQHRFICSWKYGRQGMTLKRTVATAYRQQQRSQSSLLSCAKLPAWAFPELQR